MHHKLKNISMGFGLTAFLLIFACLPVAGVVFKPETLHYVISYKWGLVHKDAGEAVLSLRDKGNSYTLQLTAKTKPWADKVFTVRDTLTSIVAKEGFKPSRYIKTAHEGGKYSKDEIKYSHNGKTVTGEVLKYREKKGKARQSSALLSAEDQAFDMLSIFYYLRTLDYSHMARGETVTTSIFSGTNKETLIIRNLGIEQVKMRDGSRRRAFHVKFNFTSSGGKKSSEDIDAWLSCDEAKIPLVLTGKLPIGQIRCYLV